MDEAKKIDEKFNIAKKGYEIVEVNEYIDTLEAALNSYKEKDNIIKNAIISAQMAADNMIKNAEIEVDRNKAAAKEKLDVIKQSIAAQKNLMLEFQNDYNAMINKYLHKFNNEDMSRLFAQLVELDEYITSLSKQNKPNE